MYDAKDPKPNELPSSAQLLRSTLLALVVAAVILVTVVLPAEYAIDPTGVGEWVGLKRMGEIKAQLVEEAEVDAVEHVAVDLPQPQEVKSTKASGEWRDITEVQLAPDEAIELKLVMAQGERAEYEWSAQGGLLNFNKHGDGQGQAIEYGKGRNTPSGSGELEAAFDGHHGWFWRNRSENPVALTLRTRGSYSELKRTR